ncbi:Protein F17C8.3 [Aphelenchoides avenae]|nr:Protein F17C8.3 [Aphelenchus avenae]
MTGSIKKCLEREESILTDPLVQRLFRLFLLFADGARVEVPASEPGHTKTLGCITAAQAHFLINEFFRQIRPHCLVSLQISLKSDRLTFRELVEFCDLVFPDRKQLEPVVDRVFDRYVSQIVGKGFLMCRSARSPHCFSHKPRRKYKSYWCTLMPGIIYLWPLHKPTTVRNRRSIVLGELCELHNGPFEDDRFTWTVITPEKEYQFGHFDEIRRQHWIAEMSLTMKYRNKEDLLRSDLEHSKRKEHLGNSEKCIAWKIALEGENQRLTELLNDERKALMLDEEREKNEKMQKELARVSEAFMVEREITEELQKW